MTQQFYGYKKMTFIGLVLFTFLMSSCYSYRVATHAQAGTELSKPVTAHSFFWGLVQKPAQIHTPICDSLQVNGMSEVTVKTNLGYAFITVVTLGIWSPMKLQWRCGKPCKKSGTL
jgi:choline-glycine betaine transporter